ncbi:MAG: type II secretion system F family protein, partial [Thermodesulfobacteriota bacterium]
MPVFAYRAFNERGQSVRGVVDADTVQKARQRLRTEGLHPLEVQPAAGARAGPGLFPGLRRLLTRRRNFRGYLAETTRQAATLLEAGLPLVAALGAIQEQAEDQDYRRLWALIREDVV